MSSISSSIDKSCDISHFKSRSSLSNTIIIKDDSFKIIKPLLSEEQTTPKSTFNLKLWNASIISGFVSFHQILGEDYAKAIYVLFILTIVFMLAQTAMWLLAATASNMQQDQNWGRGDGTGPEYDFLAGPVFAVVSILSTLPVGYITDRQYIKRETFLAIACLIWSLSTFLTGLSSHYGEIIIYRIISAMSTSAAQPLSASIISDFYPSKIRASAMAIFNFGIYIGFSIAYGLGNYISAQYNWRYAWYIFGVCGCILSIFVFCLPRYREPIKPFTEIPDAATILSCRGGKQISFDSEADIEYSSNEPYDSSLIAIPSEDTTITSSFHHGTMDVYTTVTMSSVLKYYAHSPSLILLLFASFYRNCGGYIWGYQANNFLQIEKAQTETEIASWLGWIPAVAGSIGCLFGGALSDRLAAKYGKGADDTQYIQSTVTIRIWVLVFSSLISSPLAAGMLYMDPPYGYWSLFCMYLFSEMWIAMTVTIVAELSPLHMKATLLSVYYFTIAWAGFAPQLVSPLDDMLGYYWAVFILFPGIYGSVSILFFAVIFTYKRDLKNGRRFRTLSY